MTDGETRGDQLSTEPSDPFDGPGWTAVRVSTVGEDGDSQRSRIKVSRRKRRTLQRRRRTGYVLLFAGALIVLAGAWLAVTGLMARRELSSVRAEVRTLRTQISADDLSGARETARQLSRHADRAHELTTGPIWALAAGVPAGGEPLRTIRGVTSSVDLLSRNALPQLVSASRQIDPSTVRNADGTINLARIASVAPQLNRASTTMAAATAAVSGLPARTWLPTVDRARSDLLSQLIGLNHTVRSADLAARIAPSMLGQSGPKTYFMSFESEAELRGSGGLPGAFAIVRADHGKLSFVRFNTDTSLGRTTSGAELGAQFDQLYAGASATQEYADSNVSPNFPYAAQIWVAMWRKYSGQRLDGALAIDPTALSYLLRVTGPVTLADGSKVSSGNVVALTQQTVYATFANSKKRKAYQLGIARALSQHLLDPKVNSTALVRAAGRAAGQRRLLAWSSDAAVEADLERTTLGGAVPVTSAPFVGLSINNAAANKLDYYVHASMAWRRTGCGPTRSVLVTLVISDDAPPRVPKYVLGETGRPGFPQKAGDTRLLVGYLATSGSQLTAVTLDGRSSTAAIGAERGHPVFTIDLKLARGATHTVVLTLREPPGTGSPVVLSQPMVNPLAVTLADTSCH